jgi:predicted ATPase/transcriptional regulator with XRE-family HTH domain
VRQAHAAHSSSAETPPAGTLFGTRLRALREAAGLTQEELAERAGLTAYAVSALERGRRQRPYPHTVRCLVEALGASDDERTALMEAVPRRGTAPAVQVPAPGAATAATTLATAPVRLTSLPRAATELRGRSAETDALVDLLRRGDCRLLTLTGLGGVGKTRLATAVAVEVAADFPDGAAIASLAPLSDPSGVLPAIARAVGSVGGEGPEGPRLLLEHLRPLRFLLVLDNLEHLLEAADQVADLVASCPQVVVLVTSRAPLRVRGEVEFPVQPLALPAASTTDLEAVRGSAAVAVFADRARAVSPGFELTDANAGAVAGLCRSLAGIPLALELAAARIRFLDPASLLARLGDAMARGGGPDLPPRQRTMHATFDWSYELLTPPEQRLLRVLSVFHGGADLEAVEAVSAVDPADEPVLALLEVLVEHSLVVVTSDGEGRPRFGLLEPVAQYARSRLPDAEHRLLRSAHAACYLAFAELAAPEYQAGDQVVWLDRTEREDANLVAALGWSVEQGDGETAGRMAWALWLYWWLRGRLSVGRRLAEAALEFSMPSVVRTRATLTGACMAFALGDLEAAGAGWREAVALAAAGEDDIANGQATAGVGLVALAGGDLEGAEDCFLRALPHLQGPDVYADWLESLVQVWLGTVRLVRGDIEDARDSTQRGLGSARRRGDRLTAYVALFNLAEIALREGRHEGAREHLSEGIRLTRETGDLANLVYFLETLVVVEAAGGDAGRAAVLVGAAETVREVVGGQVYGYYQPDEALRREAAERARLELGDDAFDDRVDTGRSLSPAQAIAFALGFAEPSVA